MNVRRCLRCGAPQPGEFCARCTDLALQPLTLREALERFPQAAVVEDLSPVSGLLLAIRLVEPARRPGEAARVVWRAVL